MIAKYPIIYFFSYEVGHQNTAFLAPLSPFTAHCGPPVRKFIRIRSTLFSPIWEILVNHPLNETVSFI